MHQSPGAGQGAGPGRDPSPWAVRRAGLPPDKGYFRISGDHCSLPVKSALVHPQAWVEASLLAAMLGGGSGAWDQETEGDGEGSLAEPPAIDFPAEGAEPKYDGETPKCRANVCGPPSTCVPVHSGVRLGVGPIQCLGA